MKVPPYRIITVPFDIGNKLFAQYYIGIIILNKYLVSVFIINFNY
ncbi:hypothetical protein EC844_13320 [Acinetobacter calcoaceticus]|uniref:Uncharacterized protein n=1 Tax=Acinetobacter calcoaceticus TaxID=471 RepID=A0A4R1XF06_ACICA|nr:hypothetical protein EC844_13320 [Acinetobacter calcoaceticus]